MMKILMIENHKNFAEIVIEQFLNEHEVEIISTVKSAILKLSQNKYDAALIDFHLDDGKGIELVELIRKTKTNLPIIAISSFKEKNEIMVKAGANAVCSKMEFKEITDVINDLKL